METGPSPEVGESTTYSVPRVLSSEMKFRTVGF